MAHGNSIGQVSMYRIVKNFGRLSMYPEGNQGKAEKLADKTW